MRRPDRYCLKRQQIKMSWNPINCYNIVKRKPLNEQNLNIFQSEWKSKTLCRLYFNGDVTDTVFKRTYNESGRDIFETLCNMERRLDNVVFRSHFTHSIFNARKMVSEGRILVNGRKVTWPDYRLKNGDLLQVDPKYWKEIYAVAQNPFQRIWSFLPSYLEVSYPTLSTIMLRSPKFNEIPSPYPKFMIENMGAFYSKRKG
jgi:small subunit ribosomal protein S4